MDIYYPSPPAPQSRAVHNALMIKAMRDFNVPQSFICPDCYHPIRQCEHLHERDLHPLFARPRR